MALVFFGKQGPLPLYDIDFRGNVYVETFPHAVHDVLGQPKDVISGGLPIINQYQGLFVVYPGIPKSFSFKTALLYEPASGYFIRILGNLVKRRFRKILLKGREPLLVYDGVFEKLPLLPSILGLGNLLLRTAMTALLTSFIVGFSRPLSSRTFRSAPYWVFME